MAETGSRSRTVSEVRKMLIEEQQRRDAIITSQSFFCRKTGKVVSPAFCHDCFNSLPYTERLLEWHENRMECIKVNSSPCGRRKDAQTEKDTRRRSSLTEERIHKDEKGKDLRNSGNSQDTGYRSGMSQEFPFSIEEYLCQGMLDYVLDLDKLAERFEAWWRNLSDSARERVHTSADLQEMIAWFGHRLAQFQSLVIAIGRSKDLTNNQHLK